MVTTAEATDIMNLHREELGRTTPFTRFDFIHKQYGWIKQGHLRAYKLFPNQKTSTWMIDVRDLITMNGKLVFYPPNVVKKQVRAEAKAAYLESYRKIDGRWVDPTKKPKYKRVPVPDAMEFEQRFRRISSEKKDRIVNPEEYIPAHFAQDPNYVLPLPEVKQIPTIYRWKLKKLPNQTYEIPVFTVHEVVDIVNRYLPFLREPGKRSLKPLTYRAFVHPKVGLIIKGWIRGYRETPDFNSPWLIDGRDIIDGKGNFIFKYPTD